MSDVQSFVGTRPVDPAHAFDTGRLTAWLQDHVEGFRGPLQVQQFKGGQSNPTFLLVAGDGRRFVLRRQPPGPLLPSAHAVDREFRVMRALAGTAVPVPRVHALCEDREVMGTLFYVMDCVEGRVLWDPSLPALSVAERGRVYDELNRVIAALHGVDPQAVGLGDYGRSGQYLERQIARWSKQYKAAETEPIEAADALIDWLPRHLPPGDETRIVHGDYRLDNAVFHPTEPRIVAVLDWELSTLGHPLVDFAYHCMTWRMDSGATRGLAGVDLAALGIPDETEYVRRYMERTGREGDRRPSRDDWEYYLVFNAFRLMAILQGVAKRAQQGNASSAQAADAGRRARPLAERAWALARSLVA
jgi:aminoglycoside phosphotransferase (APT) family kinase protein